jgi:hypothetical protein
LDGFAFTQGQRPWDGSKTPVKTPCRGRVVATSFLDGIKKVIEPKIKEIFPPESIESTKTGQQGSLIEVRMKNGSWFDLCSTEQESMKHEGADLDWVWFDEPCSRNHWIANTRGLVDRGGYAWMTMTPLEEPWILDECITRASVDPNYFFVQASMYDNVGFGLTEKAVKEFESSLTEDEKAVRIYGEWLVLQGLIYKEYSDHYFPDGHLIKPFVIPENWPRFMIVDPHDRTPTYILWLAVNEQDEVFAYDELTIGQKTVAEISAEIKSREKDVHDKPSDWHYRIIDPAAAQISNVMEIGSNIQDEFSKCGIYTYKGHHDINPGHKKVREYLRFEENALTGTKKPRLFVFDNLRVLRHSFQHYIFDEWVAATRDKKEPKEKPRDKHKHPMDALRYGLMVNPHFIRRNKSGPGSGYKPQNKRTGY